MLAGVTAGVRAEGERRRRQWAANYKRRFDEAGVDFMLVLTLGDKPALRADQSYAARRNNQLANSLSFPMVSFPIGYVDGLPINADFKGPRFAEPMLTQAMLDYQARYPQHHRGPAGRPGPGPRPSASRCGAAARGRGPDAVQRPARPRGARRMSFLTIGWDRAENAADLPRDSGLVFPDPSLTIGWRPMLNTSVLDWDPEEVGQRDV